MLLHQVSNSLGNYNYNAFVYTNTVWPLHFHGNFELIYTIEGVTEVTVGGTLDTLEAGYFILVPPYSTHSLTIPAKSKTWVGVFSKDHIADFAWKYSFVQFSKFQCDKELETFLLQHLLHGQETEHYLLQACLYIVCGQCLKNATMYTRNRDDSFVRDVIVFITENLSRTVTMTEVAQALNYEYHYFSTLFHNSFSMNFKQFLHILRFEQACEMLVKAECTITDVCSECGFASIRNFNRIFREYSGMTPSEYRNSEQAHNIYVQTVEPDGRLVKRDPSSLSATGELNLTKNIFKKSEKGT